MTDTMKTLASGRFANKPSTLEGDQLVHYKLLIDGELVSSDDTLKVINPATGAIFALAARASRVHLERAVAAAFRAFSEWRLVSMQRRQDKILQTADVIAEARSDLARLLTQEQGKSLTAAMQEIELAEEICRYYATVDVPVETIHNDSQQRVEMHRKPLGVVAAIVPWNYPFFVAISKIAPALLAGNTLVLKPAPTTPATTLLFGQIVRTVFPQGVLNIITDNNDLSPLLCCHPNVAKVSFTGSTATGKRVMAGAANSLKRLTLELGGNDAAIVLDDANPQDILIPIFEAAFENSGQVCNSIKRLYVHDCIYDEVCDGLAELARTAVVGNGMMPGTQIGPVQNEAQYEKTIAYIEGARRDGRIIAGGQILERPGYFVPPTVVRDISDGTSLVDEEPFGPILPIIRYSSLEDVVHRANASAYGLGGSVWSGSAERALEVAAKLDCGTAWVNQHGVIAPYIPFPACKDSGFGVERGREGLYEFTQMQILYANLR